MWLWNKVCRVSELPKSSSDPGELEDQNWKIIPPRAGHFAGARKSNVGSIKRILHITMEKFCKLFLSREGFDTLVQEALSIAKHTPLSSILADPNESLPVCPAAWLTFKETESLPSSPKLPMKTSTPTEENGGGECNTYPNSFWFGGREIICDIYRQIKRK